jgi:DNA-binding SARP family transcriptional activator/tetratricopeptide (TPR) repeat protein
VTAVGGLVPSMVGAGAAESAGTEIRLLGPLQVEVGGQQMRVPRGKPRAVLVALALGGSRPVTVDRLARQLWGDARPVQVRRTVQTYVVRLRQALGAGLVTTVPAGYRLGVPAERVDLWRFRALVATAAQASDAAARRTVLTEALALWRGEPLGDCDAEALTAEEAPRLVEEHLSALESRFDADLSLGRYAELIPELRGLAGRHRLRESLWRKLISALAGSGRTAEAIEEYHRLRHALTDDLGVDPAPELQRLYRSLLDAPAAGDSPNVPAPDPPARDTTPPRQLPADVAHFTNRRAELDLLDRLIAAYGDDPDEPTLIVVITGTAGVGKTALAVHWAHRVAARFPDGQLCLNLRGYSPADPLPAAAALATLLRTAGVAPAAIPDDLDGRSAALRTALAGRRMLVLLDNARDADQVRPLLPATGCLVVVTSRSQLRGMTSREGAQRLTLGRFSHADALALVARIARGGEPRQRPAGLDDVVELCAGLPLALRLVAERIGRLPAPDLSELAGQLHDEHERLDAFADEDDEPTDVRAVFSWSCRALDAAATRAFHLLSLHPGRDMSLACAAALIGRPPADTRRILDRLTAIHLLEQPRLDRYEFHDLLRVYAAEQAEQRVPTRQRDAATDRVLLWYLYTAHNAHRVLHPGSPEHVTESCPAGVEPLGFATHRHALDWCESERAGVVDAVGLAAAQGRQRLAWRLALSFLPHLRAHRTRDECVALADLALRTARQAGDVQGEYRAANALAVDYDAAGSPAEAIDLLRGALRRCEQAGHDPAMMAAMLNNLGLAHTSLGQFDKAIDCHQRGLVFASDAGPAMAGALLSNLGDNHGKKGDYRLAIDVTRRAIEHFRESGDEYLEAVATGQLAESFAALGQYAEADRHCEQAAALLHRLGTGIGLADILITQGHIRLATGHRQEAARLWRQALDMLTAANDPRIDMVTALLHRT